MSTGHCAITNSRYYNCCSAEQSGMGPESPEHAGTDPPTLAAIGDRLDADYGDNVAVSHYDDGTEMTPMLSITVDGGQTRADLLRDAFRFERQTVVRVSSVHRHRIVLREA